MKEKDTASPDFADVLSRFQLSGDTGRVEPFGSGHIHDTYRVFSEKEDHPGYLLQRINHHVFKQVPALMQNILLVTEHLRTRLEALPDADPEKEVLTLVLTKEDKSFYRDSAGRFWRVFRFLEGTQSLDMVTTPQLAYEGGKAFGKFQALLADLDAGLLAETIPNFHNVESRLSLFEGALERDAASRAAEVAAEIDFVRRQAEGMCTINRLGRQGLLPLRITHNDTKFNNVLFNAEGKAQCVIDLDTVMPGYVAYDFGDAIRTGVVTTPEDEADLSKIAVDMELFRGFTEGFLESTGRFLTVEEKDTLFLGATLLPFIMGLRFLTDYLDGDSYYKIHFAGHNLQRARAQFRLVELLQEKQELLQGIIQEIAATHGERQ